jgi:hypothetical protein
MIYEASLRQIDYLEYQQGLSEDMILETPIVIEFEMNDPDISAIEKTLAFFVKRHESLRTIFLLINGKIKQKVLPYDENKFALEFIDLSEIDVTLETIKEEYFNKARISFADKKNGPLIKFYLFHFEESRYKLFILIDHLICDKWSINAIIKEELTMFYQSFLTGNEPCISPLKVHLGNYCEQQNKWLTEKREELSNFWKTKLSGYYNLFDADNFYYGYALKNKNGVSENRTAKKITDQKELFAIYDCPLAFLYTVTISGQSFSLLKKMAQINKCTISSIIYASLYISFYCYTGKSKILLAAFVADRFTSANRLIIGFLIGAVYLPREVTSNSVIGTFINETFHDILTSCQNLIISDIYLGLDSSKLRESCDILVNYSRHPDKIPLLTEMFEQHIDTPGTYYPLEFTVYEYEDGLTFYWKYNKLLFNKELIEDFVRFHRDVLDFIATNGNKTIGELNQTLFPSY